MKIILDEFIRLRYNDIRSSNGLSPNGKATDSDSVIFKVRILVAQLKIQEVFPGFFVFSGETLWKKYTKKMVRKSMEMMISYKRLTFLYRRCIIISR